MADLGGSEPATDLFDQWLAHHEGRPVEPAEPEEPAPEQPGQPEPVQPPLSPEPGFPPLPTPGQHAAEASVPEAPAAEARPRHRPTHLAATHLATTHLATTTASQPPVSPGVRERSASLPHTVFFRPRRGTGRLLGGLLLGFAALTIAAAVWAWADRTFLSYGITAAVAAVTAIVWATRASASPTRLTLRGSELEIVRDGSRALFDLAAPQTSIEMRGEPGDRRWKVLVVRRSMSPYVIDGSMVDPGEFTQVLRYFHPEV
ncbi:hypothetical protein [Nocardioides sp. Iso805N]|uniref:hypothetical protein n=1 Tax=Nocardioides sp. Iso805N TaxID=1283287 RepID=UPI0003780194|nr:hypothetical protein [Nocardioides sp. Iso805N]